MNAANQIRAAINRCIEANPEPSDGSDIAAAVLWAAAEGIEHSWDGVDCVDHLQALAQQLNDTALAQATTTEGQVVPEGREPASVAGQSAAAAEEVAELVDDLRQQANYCYCEFISYDDLRRAADLLEQHHPVPVPVSERLPGLEDCDAEGRCWLYRPQTPILNPYWDLVRLDYIDPVPPTHWLPATALPLPAGEVK